VSARHGFAPAHYKTGLISIIRWGGKGGGSGGGGGGGSGLPNAGRSRPARVSACPPTLAHRRACARAPHARHTRASALRRLGNGETSEWESINFVHLARVRIRTRARTHARTHARINVCTRARARLVWCRNLGERLRRLESGQSFPYRWYLSFLASVIKPVVNVSTAPLLNRAVLEWETDPEECEERKNALGGVIGEMERPGSAGIFSLARDARDARNGDCMPREQ